MNNTGSTVIAELRYKPWGENRYTSGSTPTTFHYTGQREDAGLGGLYFYNARWYEPGVELFNLIRGKMFLCERMQKMVVEPETRIYEHIVLRNREPIIFGTRYSVLHLVQERLAYGWSAEELRYQHADLHLGQIYAALAYYADHQAEVDTLIEQRWADYRRLRAAAGDTPLRQKLRAAGRLA